MPRSVPGLLGEAFRLYTRLPLLFLTLAAGVVVPFQLIVLAATDTGPFTRGDLNFGTSLLLILIDWIVVDSLISALHVHAVADLEEGKTPRLGSVARSGLRVLPLVSAAAIMAGLVIAAGLVLLVLPGVYIYLRLTVVAQAAAMERRSWTDALNRSWELTEDNVLRVVLFFVCLGVVEIAPTLLLHHALSSATDAASFSVGVVLQVLVRSFDALATALLYFDLRTRHTIVQDGREQITNQSVDPRHYSDDERPKGWYVDPAQPHVMRYWDEGDPPSWSGKTRTPRKVRKQWRESSANRPPNIT